MKQFEKEYKVAGSEQEYTVRIVSDGQTVHAHCDCQAGQFKTLCKHVMQCIETDAEIKAALVESGLWQIYEEYHQKLAEAEAVKREVMKEVEKVKREAKNVKKKFERLLLD